MVLECLPNMQDFAGVKRRNYHFFHHLNTLSSQNIPVLPLISIHEHPAGNPSPLLSLKTDALLFCSLIDLCYTLFNKRMKEIILPGFQCFHVMDPVEWQHQHGLLHVKKNFSNHIYIQGLVTVRPYLTLPLLRKPTVESWTSSVLASFTWQSHDYILYCQSHMMDFTYLQTKQWKFQEIFFPCQTIWLV